jgi:hypothetical protein
MKKWQNLLRIEVILGLMMSCSSLESSPSLSSNTQEKSESYNQPEIPFNINEAFFPLRKNESGEIVPSYQWKECTKKFIVCLRWEKKTVYYNDLNWFFLNDYGLVKRPKP